MDQGTARSAICVSRAVKKAVNRNRLKRIAREALDPLVSRISDGYYLAVFPGSGFDALNPFARIEHLAGALKKAGILVPDQAVRIHLE